MKITQIETVRAGEFPRVIWVQIHTDSGLVGLGETYYAASTVEAAVHDARRDAGGSESPNKSVHSGLSGPCSAESFVTWER